MRELADLFGRPEAGRSIMFAGPSGSGKTEVAINLALSLVRQTIFPVTLFDLDVVKPYFRLRDMMRLLSGDEAGRLNIVEPERPLLHADIPTFPRNLHALLSFRTRSRSSTSGETPSGRELSPSSAKRSLPVITVRTSS